MKNPKTPSNGAFLETQKTEFKGYFYYLHAASYLGGLLIIAQAWLLGWSIDAIIFKQKNLQDISFYLILLLAVVALRFLLQSIASRFAAVASALIVDNLRSELYQKLQNLGPTYISNKGSGALISTISDAVNSIRTYYSLYLPAKVSAMVLPLSILVFIFPFDTISGVVFLATFPLIPIFMIIIGKGAAELNQRQWSKLARMSKRFLNAIEGYTTLKIFNAAKAEAKNIARISEVYRVETMKVLKVAFLSSVVLEFFATISIAFRLMWGQMDFFYGFFILLLAPEFYAPLRKMGTAYHARMEATAAAEKIIEIMGYPPEQNKKNIADEISTDAAEVNFENITIRFENVCFCYADSLDVLKNVSFEIKAGTKTAITGASGSGKSTIMALILGYIKPRSGKVFINNIDLNKIDIKLFRRNISYIAQTPTLFYGTIMDNLKMGNKNATDGEVENLCKRLQIDKFIGKTANGYNTLLGEMGYGLSGGEIQRIAIGRAFVRQCSLVLMDEPTASLDRKTETIIQLALREFTRGRTVFTIAHRLNTILNADEIIYIKDGIIIDKAKHSRLLKQNADYADLIANDLAMDFSDMGD